MVTKIWVLDEGSIGATLLEAMQKDQAVIYDGVAYWAEGSGKTGIIQHLKFTEHSVDNAKQLMEQLQTVASATQNVAQAVQSMQNVLMATQVLSSVVIVGAIVVQTQYLGRKLDAIQDTVDEIAQTQHEQSLVFYMDKISDYMGYVEYARSLLEDRAMAAEIRDVASPLLAHLGGKRNHIASLVDNIAGYVKTCARERSESKHFKLMLDFIHMLVDILPGALHAEHLLAARIGKPAQAQSILWSGSQKYEQMLGSYRGLMNQLNREMVAGTLGHQGGQVFMEYRPKLQELLQSPVNQMLLFKQQAKIAMQSAPSLVL
ncbi:hypothetical protein CK625_09515 [Vandammella animalimorsus]|uniref:Uncharacterized protein n=1 Tax=Vandammella animalimorsus TaxID=2029117 RepID=A0A2A2ADW1_9BURK|nr:hypothetical protein CK625_09515 [Vandammella animalimorsus]